MGRSAIMVSVILGVTYVTSTYIYAPEIDEGLSRYQATFIAASVDVDEENPRADVVLHARPPHFTWEVSRKLYGCKIVNDDLPPTIQCDFDMPRSWGGCAYVRVGVKASWDDPDLDPYYETIPVFGPVLFQPRLQEVVWDAGENTILTGDCPDPPLPVIDLPEPRGFYGLLAGILLLSIARRRALRMKV